MKLQWIKAVRSELFNIFSIQTCSYCEFSFWKAFYEFCSFAFYRVVFISKHLVRLAIPKQPIKYTDTRTTQLTTIKCVNILQLPSIPWTISFQIQQNFSTIQFYLLNKTAVAGWCCLLKEGRSIFVPHNSHETHEVLSTFLVYKKNCWVKESIGNLNIARGNCFTDR